MKVMTVIGARPQFIKCAPVSKAFREPGPGDAAGKPGVDEILVHTGQHYDYMMSKVFFDELGIPEPAYNLEVGSGNHGSQTGEMLRRIEEVVLQEKPEAMLIYGDTNSTLAGALAASKLHVPVVHVEAGLRSFDKTMPEEINRVLSDHASSLLLCPTETAVANLRAEGFQNIANEGRLVERRDIGKLPHPAPFVVNIGDVMYDVLVMSLGIAEKKSNIKAVTADRGISRYCLATVHRAENTDVPSRLDTITRSFAELSREIPVIWPVHPRTAKLLDARYPDLRKEKNLVLMEPVGYFDMLMLEKHASAILTDSGGVQKEAYWLKVPCITLRAQTEWVETVASGCNVLAPPDEGSIVDRFHAARTKPGDYSGELYGRADAAGKIPALLRSGYG